jgi:hypothetical protein
VSWRVCGCVLDVRREVLVVPVWRRAARRDRRGARHSRRSMGSWLREVDRITRPRLACVLAFPILFLDALHDAQPHRAATSLDRLAAIQQ